MQLTKGGINLRNIANIIKLDEHIEEEATIEVNNIELVTFVSYTPYQIQVNQQYPVEISLFMDEIDIKESEVKAKSLIRERETFGYIVNGLLNDNGQLDVGFLIEDDVFEEYQYLYGKYITLKADRIDSEFIVDNELN